MAVGHRGQRAENAASSGALSSSTIMVTITANTASENEISRSAVIVSSRMARCLCCRRCWVRSRVAEDAALVVVVMQLRTIRAFALTGQKKNLSRRQHAHWWRDEIDPKGVPVAGIQCGAERPGGIRAHTGYGRFE